LYPPTLTIKRMNEGDEMKKYINIFYSDKSIVKLIDDDDLPISEYIKQLESIFSATNFVILETTESTAIIRPSLITAIEVSEEPIKLSLGLDEKDLDKTPSTSNSKKTNPPKRNYIRSKKSTETKKEETNK